LEAKMILQVHDELLFEVPHQELDRLRALVRSAMEGAHALIVPLVVDIKCGPNWRDMKKA
jgi:DNA polymerase-1